MARLTLTQFGNPAEVITLDTTATPAPGPGQLLVRMEAATINDSDFLLIRGLYPVRPSFPSPVGAEGVGRVVEAGPSTSTDLVGRRVLILPTYEQGTWADEIVVSENEVVAVDGSADPAQLAMTGINPATAWGLLHRFEQLSPGDWVGQTAANGATGLYVIALAKRLGLRTLNVVRREAAADAVREAGGEHLVVGGEGIADAVSSILGEEKLSLVLDAVGGPVVGELAHALRFGGKVVSYAVLSGKPPEVSVFDKIFNEVAATGFWVINWLRSAPRSEVVDTYGQLAALVASGELSAPVEATYRLEDYRKAFEHAAATERGGKVLFQFGDV
jgi:NADPH:quinone reductase-like Zn-dependent oxidoreductase